MYMETLNVFTMLPKQIRVKQAFTRLVPSDGLSCIGDAKTVSTDTNVADSYETPAKMVMSQADFIR